MPLNGTFDCLDPSDVLALLAHRNATGVLHVRAGSTRASFTVIDGKIAGAKASNGTTFEHVTGWRELAEEVCCRALRSARGGFDFVPDAAAKPLPGSAVTAEQLVAAARQRVEDWKAVEAVIPSPRAVPRLTNRLTASRITIERDQWPAVVMIDGRHSVSALARRLDIGVLACMQILKPLVDGGAVDFAPEPDHIPAKPAPEPAADDALDSAGVQADIAAAPEVATADADRRRATGPLPAVRLVGHVS